MLFSLQLLTGSVSHLEQLLPQVAYGNLMAENLGSLTLAHFRQLLQLGQACLDYLHAICCATSKVLVSSRQLDVVGLTVASRGCRRRLQLQQHRLGRCDAR